jgi:hypothetical protein
MFDKKTTVDVKIVDVRPVGKGVDVDVTTRASVTTSSGTSFYAQHTHGTDGARGATSVGVSIPTGGPRR